MVEVPAVGHGVGVLLHVVQAGAGQTAGSVAVPAQQSAQRAPSDLSQLVLREPQPLVSSLVPEPQTEYGELLRLTLLSPVAPSESSELGPEEAAESGTHYTALHPLLQ